MPKNTNSLIEIEKLVEGQYYLVFHLSDKKLSYDGHTLTLLVISYCRTESICIDDVIHDPESDMYSAISSKIDQLESIKQVIVTLISNNSLCEKIIFQTKELKGNPEEGDLTTKEFLEWMVESGYDMTKPTTFIFDLDSFINSDQAEAVKSEIEKRGYRVEVEFLDDEIYFEIKIKLKPSLSLLSDIELYLQSIAMRYDIKYIGFGI